MEEGGQADTDRGDPNVRQKADFCIQSLTGANQEAGVNEQPAQGKVTLHLRAATEIGSLFVSTVLHKRAICCQPETVT